MIVGLVTYLGFSAAILLAALAYYVLEQHWTDRGADPLERLWRLPPASDAELLPREDGR